ncbi:hypothetical protein PInf_004957 [Phytophthora infestans]|nr:hypothetical protein PInf_004957 [Phytophthora infestans]
MSIFECRNVIGLFHCHRRSKLFDLTVDINTKGLEHLISQHKLRRMDFALLDTLAAYVLKKQKAEVTDADLIALIKAKCRSPKNSFVPDLKTLFKAKLRMDMKLDDAEARVLKYFQDITLIVEDEGPHDLIGRSDDADPNSRSKAKTRCTLLIDNVQPAMLKMRVERFVDLEHRACRTDVSMLFDSILHHAKLQETFHKESMESQGSKPDSRPAEKASRPAAKKGSTALAGGNPPVAKSSASTSSKTVRAVPDAGDVSVNHVWLNECVEAPYVVDSGAGVSMVPQPVLEAIAAVSPGVVVIRLADPAPACLTNGAEVACSQSVSLDLQLKTIAGSVNVRGECVSEM